MYIVIINVFNKITPTIKFILQISLIFMINFSNDKIIYNRTQWRLIEAVDTNR